MDYKKIVKRIIVGFSLSSFAILILFLIIITAIIGAIQNKNQNSGYHNLVGVPVEYIGFFNEASQLTGIPNWILAAIAKQESNFNPNTSYGGAYGIMQTQKVDTASGKDLWQYLISNGLGDIYKAQGYSFNDSEEMWNIFLNDPKAQIFAGAYETRYYANYVLFRKGIANSLDYNSTENMKLINWNENESNDKFAELLKRIFACYNGGGSYGMNVELDKAQHDYPNKVFKYAIEFRNAGLNQGSNETIEKAIEAGMKWVGKSPYVWGGGRTQEDVDSGKFDCSSFVHYCYASAGIQLGDRASVVTFSLVNMGEKVDFKDIKRGDLLFFDTYTTDGHIGIWLGDNKFLHDGTSTGVTISEFNGYYKEKFNGKVRRIIN